MSNTSVKTFLAPKHGAPPNFYLLGPAPLIRCSAAYVQKDNKLLFFFFAMSMLFYDCVQLTLS